MSNKTKKVDPNDLLLSLLGGLKVESTNMNEDSMANERQIELLYKYGEMIFSKEDIDIKTVLKPKQVYAFALARWFADLEEIPELNAFLKNLSIYAVSENGLSRKQFTELAKSITMYGGELDRDDRKTLKAHLMGE